MIDNEAFKRSMSLFATGVTVITWAGDNPIEGITVSAFSSLSLNPPLILFCIDQSAYAYPLMCKQTYFGVNILAAEQINLAYQFAGADREGLEALINTDNPAAVPTLKDSHATLIVKTRDRIAQGDHDIFIAEVCTNHLAPQRRPLLYHQSKMFSLPEN